jgi:hypothetical protein
MSGWRRVLEITADDGSHQVDKLRAFELILLMHVATRLWIWALRPYAGAGSAKLVVAAAATALALAALRRAWARFAITGLALILLGKVVATFPETSNHALLELLAVALLATLDRRSAEERALQLQACCWMVVIVLFSSGLQKVLYGTYFAAEFLGAFIALKPSFAEAFGSVISSAELTRLQALPISQGAGPFAVASPAVVVLSNAVYIVEIVVAFLLLWPRTRTAAAVTAILFTAALQAAARELFFGALFVNLLLLFPRSAWNLRLLPFFGLFYAALLVTRLFAAGVYFN